MTNSVDATGAAPIRLRYKADLRYDIRSESCDFIFNVQATRTRQQRVVSERLEITPDHDVHAYTDPVTHARYLRLPAVTGPLRVYYRTVVDLTHHRAVPSTLA